MNRYAIIRGARDASEVSAYLPHNYSVIGTAVESADRFSCVHHDGTERDQRLVVVIGGEDIAGWTLDGYVSLRLGSGLIHSEEIDLSHPVMKAIPA